MKIFVTGTRGIPCIPGGIESHCEELYTRLVENGVSVTLARRKAYLSLQHPKKEFEGIQFADLWASKKKSLEALTHTFLAVLYARIKGYKYIHIHAIGPGLAIPLARILGLKVVFTHHGFDYDRKKWGRIAKLSLKMGEWCAAKFANEIIVISETINDYMKKAFKRKNAHLIHNAVIIPSPSHSDNFISMLGLEKRKYIIAVGRFVPEKGWMDLLHAVPYIKKNYKIVFVGDSDHPTVYSEDLKRKARDNHVILTGYITGEELDEIYSHAALFVLPSYHEGLPIALLEAMSYNLNTVVSNIPANLEVNLPEHHYFEVGDYEQLASRINSQLNSTTKHNYSKLLFKKYNWDTIVIQTQLVYAKLMNMEVPQLNSSARKKNKKLSELSRKKRFSIRQPLVSH